MNTDIGGKEPYYFGNLKEALTEQRIMLIYEEGIGKLSPRKAVKKVGVSAAACCDHFGNVDDLPWEVYSYVTDRFIAALKQVVEDNPCHHVTISMGVTYAELFTKYSRYFNFLFDSEYSGMQIKETEIIWNNPFTPSEIFVTGAKRGMRELDIDERKLRDDLLIMWAAVCGLVTTADMKGVQYDSGDWGALTGRLLLSKIIL